MKLFYASIKSEMEVKDRSGICSKRLRDEATVPDDMFAGWDDHPAFCFFRE